MESVGPDDDEDVDCESESVEVESFSVVVAALVVVVAAVFAALSWAAWDDEEDRTSDSEAVLVVKV